MAIPALTIRRLLGFLLFLSAYPTLGQTGAGQFSCEANLRASLGSTELKFVELTSPEAIKSWQVRPAIAFDGFDSAKQGLKRVEFFRWHVPVPGREGYDQGIGGSTDRLALAVRVTGPSGEHWYELANTEDSNDGTLFIEQHVDPDAGNSAPASESEEAGKGDAMATWLEIVPTTPDSKMPLYMLSYWHREGGAYQVETFTNRLLIDLRSGSPKVASTLSCSEFEPIGGACSAQDEANSGKDGLQCASDSGAADFRCVSTRPYGEHSPRVGRLEFYLFSGVPAKGNLENRQIALDVGELAFRIRKNSINTDKAMFVASLGKATLLQKFNDLLPGTEVFVFASPGAGGVFNSHLSLVTLTADGKPVVQTIPKWGISGEATDESEPPKDFEPIPAEDVYHSHILEQRPGFRVFDAVLSAVPGRPDFGHVLYWIGLEVVDGNLVASAVRLATDGYVYGGCGTEFHEGTATSVQRKPNVAEAKLRVQGQFEYEYTDPFPEQAPKCVWTSVLHWKPGAGFRSRKLADECKLPHQEVTITEDGVVHGKDLKPHQE